MKLFLVAATALVTSGAALAYQSYGTDVAVQPTATAPTVAVTYDPNVAISPPATWTADQLALYEQHMDYFPATWTAEDRAMYQHQLMMPPSGWTPEQRALWQQHMAGLPTTWTAQQRAMYQQQIASLQTPWAATQQTASTSATGSYAMAPASDRIIEPSNADPEHDARGIAVISAPAVVPPGYNGLPATAMGGPLVDADGDAIVDADASYPPCTASVTDNCIQLYERGVRASLASWDRPTGGATGMGGPIEEGNDNTAEDDGLDVDTRPDGTLDVDGDLDGDGDNDLE